MCDRCATGWRLWLTIGSLAALTLACSDSDTAPVRASAAELPVFESSAAELQQNHDTVTAKADQGLAKLAALVNQAPQRLGFANTVHALISGEPSFPSRICR
jgi:hypothetical protein